MDTTHYDAILDSIASRFFNDLPVEQKPSPDMSLETIKSDLLNFTASCTEDPAWMVWIKVQERRLLMTKRELNTDRAFRISPSELLFLSETALHMRDHSYIARISIKTLESISACKIDRYITVSDLAQLPLPNYLWMEWPIFPKNRYPPWISRTVGMFISRFVLLDAPRHRIIPMLEQPNPNEDYTMELMKALARNTIDHIPCLGYQLIIAQRDDHGYRFIPCMFGHERAEPLVSMLELHKEMSSLDRRKHLQTEQVWSNVAIRLLLFAAHRQWFLNIEQPVFVEDTGSCALPDSTHTLYMGKKDKTREVRIRPNYSTPFQPFSVRN